MVANGSSGGDLCPDARICVFPHRLLSPWIDHSKFVDARQLIRACFAILLAREREDAFPCKHRTGNLAEPVLIAAVGIDKRLRPAPGFLIYRRKSRRHVGNEFAASGNLGLLRGTGEAADCGGRKNRNYADNHQHLYERKSLFHISCSCLLCHPPSNAPP